MTPTWTRSAIYNGVSRSYDPAMYLRSALTGAELTCNDDGSSMGGMSCGGTGGDTMPWGSRLAPASLPRGVSFVYTDERNANSATLPNEGMSFTVGYYIAN